MHGLRLLFTMMLTCALVLAPLPGRAAPSAKPPPPKTIAVLPLDFEGEGQAIEETLRKALQEGLLRGDVRLVQGKQVQAALDDPPCERECIQRVAGATETDYVVRPKAIYRDRVFQLRLEIFDGELGRVVASSQERCEICGVKEVHELFADQVAALLAKLENLAMGPPVLLVESTPPDARVLVDQQLVGTTPYRGEVTPGEHEVRLELDGYIGQQRTVDTVKGMRESLQVNLEPVPPDSSLSNRRKQMRIWGGAGLGVGLAVAGAGVPLVVLHDRQYEARCEGDDIDINGNCRYSYDTMAGGISLLVTGGVVAVVGLGLVIAGRKRMGDTGRRARVVPGRGGLAVRF